MKKYEKYKDSGIEWIGEIPAHWDLKKANYCFSLIGSGTTPTAGKTEYYAGGEYNWLQTGDLNNFEITYTSKKITKKALQDYPSLKFYPVDSIVIAMYGATIGKTGLLKIESATNQACCVLSKPLNIDGRFAFYWLNSIKEHAISLSYGGGQPNISQEVIRNIKMQVPPLHEQTTIATYLDQKTSEIDELIADKKRLIELYEEEKKAIINQAVTKGLDDDVPMKDSGIEWLGEIPAHWEVKRIKHIARVNPNKEPELKNFTEEVVFLPMEKVSEDGRYNDEVKKTVQELWNGFTFFKRGDIIIAKITPCFENGKGAYLKDLETDFGFGSTEFHVLRPMSVNSAFLYYLTRSDVFMNTGEAFMTGAAGQKRVPTSFIAELEIALPPDVEQHQIVHHIETECNRIDEQVERTQKLIELLSEYRTALISEVVTGKVRVVGD